MAKAQPRRITTWKAQLPCIFAGAVELKNGAYYIQGIPVADICNEFGTPLYVYDADIIIRQLNALKTAFANAPLRVKFAAKALTNMSVLKLLHRNGAGVDVVSIEEARLALRAGIPANAITFTPNGVSFEEIREAVHLDLLVTVDNLPTLRKFGQVYGDSHPCSIRLNPDIMAGGNFKIATGHGQAKFGIAVAQLDEVLKMAHDYQIQVEGLHIHTGSEIEDSGVFLQSAGIFFDMAHHFPLLRFLDFGGGFKVPYRDEDKGTDITDIGKRLSQAFNDFCERYGRELELWVEPGKFLVSEAGLLLASVNVVKETPSLTFVGINSGLNHLIRPMMYDAYHRIVNISNPDGPEKEYDVVGYICETDTFGSNRMISKVKEGDILAILNAGAYGYSMASNYNARLRPAEVLVSKGRAQLIRQREQFEDLLRGQIIAND